MFDLKTFTTIHTVVSLIALAAGLVVVYGLTDGRKLKLWTPAFLVTAVYTTLSGFLFPNLTVTPAVVVGVISTVVLILLFVAQAKGWRRTYLVTTVLSVYFLAFVTIAQAFNKIPALKALAPTQSEPPFGAAQGVVLLAFLFAGFLTFKAFGRRPGTIG